MQITSLPSGIKPLLYTLRSKQNAGICQKLPWWPLLALLNWHPVIWSSHCSSFEDRVPDLQMSCSDLTKRSGTNVVALTMTTRDIQSHPTTATALHPDIAHGLAPALACHSWGAPPFITYCSAHMTTTSTNITKGSGPHKITNHQRPSIPICTWFSTLFPQVNILS